MSDQLVFPEDWTGALRSVTVFTRDASTNIANLVWYFNSGNVWVRILAKLSQSADLPLFCLYRTNVFHGKVDADEITLRDWTAKALDSHITPLAPNPWETALGLTKLEEDISWSVGLVQEQLKNWHEVAPGQREAFLDGLLSRSTAVWHGPGSWADE